MKIAIATCAGKPHLTAGDRALASALERLGARTSSLVWNDPAAPFQENDAVLIRSTWDYHLHGSAFRDWIQRLGQAGIRLVNGMETLLWNLDKAYLQELAQAGHACVPFFLADPTEAASQLQERLFLLGWEEIVLKPTFSAGSYLTFRTRPRAPEFASCLARIRAHSGVLVQPYLPGIEAEGELSLIFFQGAEVEFSHALLKRPRAGDFRVQEDFGGHYQRVQADPALLRRAAAVLQAVPGKWAFARVDYVNWNTQPLLGEVELIEPDLYLAHAPGAEVPLASAIWLQAGKSAPPPPA